MQSQKLDISDQIEGFYLIWMTEHQQIPSNSHF